MLPPSVTGLPTLQLFMHFWKKKEKEKIAQEAMQALTSHSWPGNIRDRKSRGTFGVSLSDEITADLPPPIGTAGMNNIEPIFNAIPSVWNTPSAPVNPPADNAAVSARLAHPPPPIRKVYPLRLQYRHQQCHQSAPVTEPSHDEIAANILASAFAPERPSMS